MATIDWSGLMKILKDQSDINKDILVQLEDLESRLTKLEKKPKKKKAKKKEVK